MHVVFVHVALSAHIRALYEPALPAGAKLSHCVVGNGGSAYSAHADQLGTWEAFRAKYAPGATRVVLVIHSAAYGLVRRLIERDGIPAWIVAVVALDSIYGSTDPATMRPRHEHVAPWVRLARETERRAFAFTWVASDVQTHDGDGKLEPGEYESTGEMMQAVAEDVGIALEFGGPLEGVVRVQRGRLLLGRYGGRDAKAHSASVGVHGPGLVRETLAMLPAEDAPPAPPPPTGAIWTPGAALRLGHRGALGTPLGDAVAAVQTLARAPTVDGWWGTIETDPAVRRLQREAELDERSVFGDDERVAAYNLCALSGDRSRLVLVAALNDLSLGVHEDIGNNDGHRIREMARLSPGGWIPGANWCAVAVSAWLLEAWPGLVEGSHGAKALGAQLRHAGAHGVRYFTAAQLRADPSVLRGRVFVAIWDRSDGTPAHAWWGHVGLGYDATATAWWSLEGNSGSDGRRCARMRRLLADPRLICVAVLP